MDPFLGEIRPVPFNFAPLGWALCDGQLLSISQNTALFSLLGTFYGGNGTTTFALPDLRGRAAISDGMGPGLSNYSLGEILGVEATSLTEAQLPSHVHPVVVGPTVGTSRSPINDFPATAPRRIYGDSPDAILAADALSTTGGSQAHSNMQPYLVVNYIIALQGIFPSRS